MNRVAKSFPESWNQSFEAQNVIDLTLRIVFQIAHSLKIGKPVIKSVQALPIILLKSLLYSFQTLISASDEPSFLKVFLIS